MRRHISKLTIRMRTARNTIFRARHLTRFHNTMHKYYIVPRRQRTRMLKRIHTDRPYQRVNVMVVLYIVLQYWIYNIALYCRVNKPRESTRCQALFIFYYFSFLSFSGCNVPSTNCRAICNRTIDIIRGGKTVAQLTEEERNSNGFITHTRVCIHIHIYILFYFVHVGADADATIILLLLEKCRRITVNSTRTLIQPPLCVLGASPLHTCM